MGAAALLGVRLSRNFDHPYQAVSLRDFWHRWHISLTRWFTDYLYIPLGGSRCGAVRCALNTLTVFLLSGLWHGCSCILWSGAVSMVCCCSPRSGFSPLIVRVAPHPAARLLTLAAVCFAWVFFRAASVSDALTLFSRLPCGWDAASVRTAVLTLGLQPAAQLVLGALCLRLMPEKPLDVPAPRGVLAFCLLTLAVAAAWFAALHAGTANAFIYFQF